MVEGYDAILAVDVGGTNFRAGIVELNLPKAKDLSKARVATGRDARGRKQYLYHADWRDIRDRDKYERLGDFARLLPRIRQRVDEDMSLRGTPREKVLATVVSLL